MDRCFASCLKKGRVQRPSTHVEALNVDKIFDKWNPNVLSIDPLGDAGSDSIELITGQVSRQSASTQRRLDEYNEGQKRNLRSIDYTELTDTQEISDWLLVTCGKCSTEAARGLKHSIVLNLDTNKMYRGKMSKVKSSELWSKIDRHRNAWRQLNVQVGAMHFLGATISGKTGDFVDSATGISMDEVLEAVKYDEREFCIDTKIGMPMSINTSISEVHLNASREAEARKVLNAIMEGIFLQTKPKGFYIITTEGSTPDDIGTGKLRVFEWITADDECSIAAKQIAVYDKVPFFSIPIQRASEPSDVCVESVVKRVCRKELVPVFLCKTTNTQDWAYTRKITLKRNNADDYSKWDDNVSQDGGDCWKHLLYDKIELTMPGRSMHKSGEFLQATVPILLTLATLRCECLDGVRCAAGNKCTVRIRDKSSTGDVGGRLCHSTRPKGYGDNDRVLNRYARLAYLRHEGRNSNIELWD